METFSSILRPISSFFRSEDEEGDENRFYYNGGEANRSTGPPLYPHNTYHGPGLGYNHHQRTPLAQANFRPLKFTDKYSPRTSSSMNNGDQDAIQDEVSFYLDTVQDLFMIWT